MSPKVKAHAALFFVALIYGINYTVAKDVMAGYIGPRGFILLRVLGASILFWVFHAFSKTEKVDKKDFWRLAVCGLFGISMNQMLFFEGLNLSTPINASIIMTVNPVIVLSLSALVFKEKLTSLKIVGIVLGMVGAIHLISGGGKVSLLESDTAFGNLLVLGNATSYAFYLILVQPLMKKYSALTVIKWVFLFGLFYTVPFGWKQFADIKWMSMSWLIIGETAFVVVFTTFIAYLFNIYAMKTVTGTTVSIYIYFQPVFATLSSFIVGADLLTISQVFSAALIFAGVYFVSFSRKSKEG